MGDPCHNVDEILNKPAAGRFFRMTNVGFFVCQSLNKLCIQIISTSENVNVFHLSVPTDMFADRLRPEVSGLWRLPFAKSSSSSGLLAVACQMTDKC